MCIGAFISHLSLKKADQIRFGSIEVEERFYLPNPDATKALSLGHQTMVGDILWVRTILIFSDFAFHCREKQAQWLLSMIRAIAVLDPQWRTLYFYGGTMMGVCDEYCLLYTSPSPRDYAASRMPSSA